MLSKRQKHNCYYNCKLFLGHKAPGLLYRVSSSGKLKMEPTVDTVYVFPSKQNKLLSEKLWINPREKFIFQKLVFLFPLPLMILKPRGMQKLSQRCSYCSPFLTISICWVPSDSQLHFLCSYSSVLLSGEMLGLFCGDMLRAFFGACWRWLPGWGEILYCNNGWYK